MIRPGLAAATLLSLLAGVACVPVRTTAPVPVDTTALRLEAPRSILVVPVLNQTVDVAASDAFLTTLSVPLVERGYYVFPVYLVKRLLEDEGLADPGLVHQADSRRLGALFGADAILYVTIQRWTARYEVLGTKVAVEFDYLLKSGRTGAVLWRNHESRVQQSQGGNSGNALADVVAMMVSASLSKAAPSYLPLAREANAAAFGSSQRGLPPGPHHP